MAKHEVCLLRFLRNNCVVVVVVIVVVVLLLSLLSVVSGGSGIGGGTVEQCLLLLILCSWQPHVSFRESQLRLGTVLGRTECANFFVKTY